MTIRQNGEPDSDPLTKGFDQQNKDVLTLDDLPHAACFVQEDDRLSLVCANEEFYSLFGYSKSEEKKTGFQDIWFTLDLPDSEAAGEALKQAQADNRMSFHFNLKAKRKSGREIHLSFQCRRRLDKPMVWMVRDCTKSRETEQKLHIIQQEQRIVMQQTGSTITQYDVASRTLTQPQDAADRFGLPLVCKNVPYSIAEKVIAEESRQEYIRFYEDIIQGKPRGNSVVRVRSAEGEFCWYSLKYTLIYDNDGKPYHAIITYEDITDLQEKELAYKKWRDYFTSQQAESIAYYEYNLTTDTLESTAGEMTERIPVSIRQSFYEVADYVSENFVCPEYKQTYLDFLERDSLESKYYMGQKEFRFEHRRIREDGSSFWALMIVQLTSDPYTGDIKASILVKDIDEEKESYLHLQQLSQTDPLTGLLNRYAMIQDTNELLQKGGNGATHIMLMIDLDNFKGLNDTMGHQFGDQVLCDIAQLLKSGVHSTDLCARLGGDEFVVVLKNTSLDTNLSNRLQGLCNLLSKDYGNGVKTSGSVGLAIYPKDGTSFEQLYEKADAALYRAKRNGRNQFVFYEK